MRYTHRRSSMRTLHRYVNISCNRSADLGIRCSAKFASICGWTARSRDMCGSTSRILFRLRVGAIASCMSTVAPASYVSTNSAVLRAESPPASASQSLAPSGVAGAPKELSPAPAFRFQRRSRDIHLAPASPRSLILPPRRSEIRSKIVRRFTLPARRWRLPGRRHAALGAWHRPKQTPPGRRSRPPPPRPRQPWSGGGDARRNRPA